MADQSEGRPEAAAGLGAAAVGYEPTPLPVAEAAPPTGRDEARLPPLLLVILVAGLLLRVVGIQWGLPSSQHQHSYHPDEIILVWAAQAVNPLAGSFDPQFYNYGSLTILLLRVAHDAVELAAPVHGPEWAVTARYELIGRLLVVLFGTLTLLLVYDIGRRLAGRGAGLAAAALMAVMPANIAHAHSLNVDVPATFFVAAALSVALRLLERPSGRWALLAGVCAGLAAATKYNAGLVLLAPLAALALRGRPRVAAVADAALAVAGAAAAFLAGCPGVLLNTPAFLRDFTYEARHVQTGHGLLFVNTLPGWIYHLAVSLRLAMGLPLLAVALAGMVCAGRRRSPADIVLAAWVVPYYLLIGAAQVKFLRYVLPLLPALAAWSSAICSDWLFGAAKSRAQALASAVLVGVGFWGAGSAVAYDLLFTSPDPRDRAAERIRAALPHGGTIALLNVPWYYTPPIVPWNGGTKTRSEFEAYLHRGLPYTFVPGGTSLLVAGDLKDAGALAARLQAGRDPVSRELRSHFAPASLRLLAAYRAPLPAPPALQEMLMDELNRRLAADWLYNSERFAGIPLTDEIRRLMEQTKVLHLEMIRLADAVPNPAEREQKLRLFVSRHPEGQALIRLNRLLLEQAYPEAIEKRPEEWTPERLAQVHPDCFIVTDLEVRDALRLRNRADTADTRAVIAQLNRTYDRETLHPPAAWPGLLGPGYPPEDWLYPAPTVTLYFRR